LIKPCKRRQQYCTEEGAHFLSPFDDEDVIEGQPSVAVEIEKGKLGPCSGPIMLPVGGGDWSSGI